MDYRIVMSGIKSRCHGRSHKFKIFSQVAKTGKVRTRQQCAVRHCAAQYRLSLLRSGEDRLKQDEIVQ